MRAIVCDRVGWPQPLAVRDWPVPDVGPGQILVRVAAAGVNFADSLLIGGSYQERPDPPFVPGAELAGEVVALGADVTGFAVGDRVMGQVDTGAYAEYAVLDARRAAPVPSGMPFDQAAGFWIPYGTAYCGLVTRGRLRPGEVLLVTGAAGGVGLAAVEIGAALGARVIALAGGGADRQQVVRQAGATAVLDPRDGELKHRIREVAGPAGIDLAFDVVGGPVTAAVVSALAFQGRLVVVGFASGEVPQVRLNHVLVKNIDIVGFYWGPYQTRFPAETREMFDRLAALYRRGALRPRVAARYPLERAGEALADLLSRRNAGRIVIDPALMEGEEQE